MASAKNWQQIAAGKRNLRDEALKPYTINSITEPVFDDALVQARRLDELFRETGELQGPLHGVPMTYVERSFRPAEEDAVIVALLKQMGAVIMFKTNLPQSILWAETDNPLRGWTNNPCNPDLTPGGSTGGEAALLALHGSILGLGTDIGGSIRIPGALNGLYAFKPTPSNSSRYPSLGVPNSNQGQEHIPFFVGPLARTLSSICHLSRQRAFAEIQSQPLVMGLILDDGVVKVLLWDTSDHHACARLMDRLYTAGGCEDIRRDIDAAGEPMILHVRGISVYEYWQLNRERVALQQAYLAKWVVTRARARSGRAVDILLGPVAPHTAVPHGRVRWTGYTRVWNLLDYSALAFPVDVVRGDVDGVSGSVGKEAYESRNEMDAWNWRLFDPEIMDGHPVGLQIVGRKLQEEVVLGAATVIERVLREDK
ncbi:amidase signature domain-containing protein [Aspergillus venezuelensis]